MIQTFIKIQCISKSWITSKNLNPNYSYIRLKHNQNFYSYKEAVPFLIKKTSKRYFTTPKYSTKSISDDNILMNHKKRSKIENIQGYRDCFDYPPKTKRTEQKQSDERKPTRYDETLLYIETEKLLTRFFFELKTLEH